MTELMIYKSACIAIASAKTVDEVLELQSRADAVRAYAHQSKNITLELDAAEIRIRATRKLGQLLNVIMDDGHIEPGQRPRTISRRQFKRLLERECNVSENLVRRAVNAAKPDDLQFERLVDQWRKTCLSGARVGVTLPPTQEQIEEKRAQDERQKARIERDRLRNYKPPIHGLLGRFWLPGTDYIFHHKETLGEMHVDQILPTIEQMEQIMEDFSLSIKILQRILDHFGGGFQHLPNSQDIRVEQVLSNSRLEAMLKELNIEVEEESVEA